MDPSQFFVKHKWLSDDLNSNKERSSQQNKKEPSVGKAPKRANNPSESNGGVAQI